MKRSFQCLLIAAVLMFSHSRGPTATATVSGRAYQVDGFSINLQNFQILQTTQGVGFARNGQLAGVWGSWNTTSDFGFFSMFSANSGGSISGIQVGGFVIMTHFSSEFSCVWTGNEISLVSELETADQGMPGISSDAKEVLNNAQALKATIAVQEKHTPQLMKTAGVIGTGTGLTKDGKPCVVVYTERAGVAGIPAQLNGTPVEVRMTGKIVAQANPRARFPRPVPIGTSHSPVEAPCYSGTGGCRVIFPPTGDRYILSNNHVLANENDFQLLNTAIVQPSRGDNNCAQNGNDVVAVLSAYVPMVFSTSANNQVDAAVAFTLTTLFGNSTPTDDGYGTPRTATTTAFVGQAVQKYGRTTGRSGGTVTAVNVMINVGYQSGTARFINQIAYQPRIATLVPRIVPMSLGGDSGSLVVTDPGRNPVALNFAGNGQMGFNNRGFGNPINLVLSAFGVVIDGE